MVFGVVRTGCSFGMVLNRKDRKAGVFHPFNTVVVEVDVGDLNLGRQAVGLDRESVIVSSNLNGTALQILHRLVPAPVAIWQLISSATERTSQQLMPETNAERRHARRRYRLNLFDDLVH